MNFSKGLCKQLLTVLALLLLLPLAVSASEPKAATEQGQAATEQGKAAEVNGAVITREDFDNELNSFRQRMMQQGRVLPEAELGGIRKEVLNQLIDRILLFQDSKTRGIAIENSAVQAELSKLKGRFPNEDAFKNALAASNTTEADLTEKITEGLAIRQLIDTHIAPNTTVTDKEAQSFYEENPDLFAQDEQVKASHILIKLDPAADDVQKAKAKKEIEDLQKKLKEGAEFAQLAKEHSQGPSGPKGGDLGFFSRGQMVKPFENVAFELKVGEVSEIVETRFGYHLILVTEKKPTSVVPFKEAEGKIREHLKQKKLEQEVVTYLQALRQKAKIEKFI